MSSHEQRHLSWVHLFFPQSSRSIMAMTALSGNSKIEPVARMTFFKCGGEWMKCGPPLREAKRAIQTSRRRSIQRKNFSWRTQIERQLSYFRKAIGRDAQSIQIGMMSSFAIQREAVGTMTLQRLVIAAEIS
jgi:hypothetical protein